MDKLVTVLIPNYKTLALTKLCLRLLRKFTDPDMAHFIVIDNDSQDESLDYLRTLKWIELIERKSIPGESGPLSHSRALDLGLERVTTPYVLSIHTDTLVRNAEWLNYLLSKFQGKSQVAGIGSWKLESKPLLKRLAKAIERKLQIIYYRLRGSVNHALEGQGKNYYYLRSHCALYRTDLLRQLNLTFSGGDEVAGKLMHKALVDHGYQMLFLPSEQLGQYIDHINHATMILNPHLGARDKTIKQGMRRIRQRLKIVNSEEILQNELLDG